MGKQIAQGWLVLALALALLAGCVDVEPAARGAAAGARTAVPRPTHTPVPPSPTALVAGPTSEATSSAPIVAQASPVAPQPSATPTRTPRPTRTVYRPTGTWPTATPTETPVGFSAPTASAAATRTPAPTALPAAPTPVPPAPTPLVPAFTPTRGLTPPPGVPAGPPPTTAPATPPPPPASTPKPPPLPTATPPPTATPKPPPTATPTLPPFPYLVRGIGWEPNCGLTQVKIRLSDASNPFLRINGVRFRVQTADNSWGVVSSPTGADGQEPGYTQVTMDNRAKVASWQVIPLDAQGNPAAPGASFTTDTQNCQPGGSGHQVAVVDWAKYY